MSTPEQIRQEQIAEAQRRRDPDVVADVRIMNSSARPTIGLPSGKTVAAPTAYRGPDRRTTAAPGAKLKGHEAFIKALEGTGADVVLEKASSGHVYYGKFKHSDKWSVTMLVLAIETDPVNQGPVKTTPYERVIYKHDISEFYTTTARPERT